MPCLQRPSPVRHSNSREKGNNVGRRTAVAVWAVCGFVLTALVPWLVLVVAALVLAALASWIYLAETADDE